METQTTVVESQQWTVTPKKPKKRKNSKSLDRQSNGEDATGCTRTASNVGDDGKGKPEANKRERIVLTPKLHGKFVKACNELGIEDAVPMKILQRMKTTGITRAQVASHLQKYRDSLSKRKDVASIGESSVTALHHTPPVHLPAGPPSPRSPLETPICVVKHSVYQLQTSRVQDVCQLQNERGNKN
ncbi:hypothetical protein HU200_056753 [Digitaria exilis]|uniref:HTH myb-type domain-containing protein n=1 Tax=Digitaria exilis TaxID=1010633 RepID=A0A835ALW5_9POAL|nr:hypothetical protein HU200_056753 [Digitaria exilis]